MATHDYVLDNATGANFRADINNALAAIVSNNSSSTEPSTKYAYQWWADTNEGVLKIRNSANDGWVTLLQLDGTLTLEDGSASAPALGFRDDLNTGIFSSAADNLDITTGGTTRVNVSSTGINVTGTVVDDGATHDGDVTFTGDSANIVFDKSDNQLEFADNAKAEFGTGGDFEIFHNGTQNIIGNTATQVRIITDQLRLRSSSGSETYAQANVNSAFEANFDNAKKFETLSDGVRITSADDSSGGVRGDFLFQQTDGTTVATFDASASTLKFEDNRKAVFGAGDDLEIYHSGSHSFIKDTGTGQLVVNSNSFRVNNAADSENMIKADENSAVSLFFDDSQKFFTSSTGVSLNNGDLDVNTNNIKFGHCSSAGSDDTLMFGTNGDDLEIFHGGNGQIDCKTGNIEIRNKGTFSSARSVHIRAKADEGSVSAVSDGGVELYFDNSKKLETLTGGVNIVGALTVNGSAVGGGGKILQVVQNIYKTDQSFSTTGSFFDTGLTATITPTSSSSKILIFAQLTFQPSNAAIIAFKILRGSTSLDVGVSGGGTQGLIAGTQNGSRGAYPSMQILDTPSTTSSTTYKVQASSSTNTRINGRDTDYRACSVMTLMEVGA